MRAMHGHAACTALYHSCAIQPASQNRSALHLREQRHGGSRRCLTCQECADLQLTEIVSVQFGRELRFFLLSREALNGWCGHDK